jgi:lipopolysaccharide export system protein LptA
MNSSNGGAFETARRLTTDELRLAFLQKGSGNDRGTGTKLASADTAAPGRIEWADAGNATVKPSQTILRANRLGLKFDVAGKPAQLDAGGNVQTERTAAGVDKQTATAKNGSVRLREQGGWSQMELSEDVRLNEGTRSARADHAVFERAEQTATLTGHATARDASNLTSAEKLTFWQSTSDVQADGNVRSSDLSARGGAMHLAPVAANISADHLTGNSKSGQARYTGHARLWQGDSVLEAESIELMRNDRRMNAVGNVRSVFPQAAANAAVSSSKPAQKLPVLWHVQSGKLIYWDREDRAQLEQNVVVQSPDEKISSESLDLYFTRANPTGNSTVAAANVGGPQQISRAVASGGVIVQQGERRATAQRGEYTAADGKFVMTGGTPAIFDAASGTTTGRQLTFFLADATIIVDSDQGSRTLTKHLVEK